MTRSKIAILGADISAFHIFNRLYRSDDRYEVSCFFELHQSNNYDQPNLPSYPIKLTGDQAIPILYSFPYKHKNHPNIDKVIFSPSAMTSYQFLYSTAEFMAMDASIVINSLESTQLPPPKALISFFSSTQFDIPILLKLLELYKSAGIKLVVAMPAPVIKFKSNDTLEFFYRIENINSKDYQILKTYYRNRHELETIEAVLNSGFCIYLIYDFEKFSSEAMRRSDFNAIVFVGFNLLPCFFESHLVIFACDDFTFGSDITIHPSYITYQQADVVIYAHLREPESVEKIKGNDPNKKFVCIPVKYSAKNSDCYWGKTALLVDDSYPTRICRSNESISQFLAQKFNMKIFPLEEYFKNDISEKKLIYGIPSEKKWPAIILPETRTAVTDVNENQLVECLKHKQYHIVLSSTSGPSGLVPPSPIQVMQANFEVILDNMKLDLFKLDPQILVGKGKK